jgi:Flp pilus assembly protein TadD
MGQLWLKETVSLGAAISAAAMLMACSPEKEPLHSGLFGSVESLRPATQPEDLVAKGQAHFRRGEYGLAERSFRTKIQSAPQHVGAWVGLAASYDELKRFDLAYRAHQRALSINGSSGILLNNLGYHYLIQNKRQRAKQTLEAALRLDPDNQRIKANLALVQTWPAFPKVASVSRR